MVEALSVLVEKYAAGKARLEEVREAVEQYSRFIWEHLGREEGVILPAAQRYLTEADWNEVNAAFEGNKDPRFSGNTDAEFKRLFSRIVNLATPRQE